MDKSAIKSFSIWTRNKLIADISYKAGLLGITEKEIKGFLPQSTHNVQFFDIGNRDPYSISGESISQRKRLVEKIQRKAKQGDYATAYKSVIEEVAYTWFNRLIAIRFMEVNGYLPTGVRVLSSESKGKLEPDIVTHALEVDLGYTAYEKDRIMQLKLENELDELFRMLFIKQCNALNENLPELFEKTKDYTELLFNVSFTDKDGVVYRLVNDISEDDFDVSKEGQVEIIGWLYQYYNTEPKDETFALLKKNVKITKERIPAATQLFTPHWIVRYMVENSLGRLWLEGHLNDELKSNWKYYLDEAEQEEDVQKQLDEIRKEYKNIRAEDIKLIDPAMGSGHILVYAFEVLMQIYESEGYSPRDAAKLILEKNIYGLDIDCRAYQLAYFSLMMKARQYNRHILYEGIKPQIYHPAGFPDGEEYGSLVKIDELPPRPAKKAGQLNMDDITFDLQVNAWNFKRLLTQKYDVVVTNPPYMGNGGFSASLSEYIGDHYLYEKNDLYSVMMSVAFNICSEYGYVSMITMQSWLNAPTFLRFRKALFEQYRLLALNNLGSRAFDEIQGEKVKNATFVFSKKFIPSWKPLFVDLTNVSGENAKRLQYLEHKFEYGFSLQDNFSKHPLCLVIYKTKLVNEIYHPSKMMGEMCDVKRCIATGNDEMFIRMWHEVRDCDISKMEIKEDKRWFYVANGGLYRRWYGNLNNVIDWENDGARIKEFNNRTGKSTLRNLNYMFLDGVTYTYTSMGSGVFNSRYLPKATVSIGVGPIITHFADIKYILAYTNSIVFRWYIDTMYGKVSTFETGNIGHLPFIYLSDEEISSKTFENIALSRTDWDSFETSWDFSRHPLFCGEQMVAVAFKKWERETAERFDMLKSNEEELNRIFIDIYGLQDELTPEVEDKDVTVHRIYDIGDDIPESMRSSRYALTKEDVIKSFISYAIGCMFGRYSLDIEGLAYAGGEWDGSKYKTFIPDKDNILLITDEGYFNNDIMGLFVDFVEKVYGEETLEENLDFIAQALGTRGNSSREVIRNYIIRDFFKDHCRTYKKRPIYWFFDSGRQNGFKAFIYMHRYDENTIGNLRIDYLHKMQRIYENEISGMQDTIDNSNNAREVTSAVRRKEKLIKQLQETKEYDEKIAHLALARIPIDLDDGVKANYEKVQRDRDGNKYNVLAKI